MTKKHDIKKLLMAGRGEIACRVMTTAQKMNIETVAIYADDDKQSRHVRLANHAVSLGAGALSDTYLNIDKIIKIAKDQNCDAIHPGYGFLAENPDFVKSCNDAGILFIGPSADVMQQMGAKDKAKQIIEGINPDNLIPGYHGDNQDPGFLENQAIDIGFPVMIKASSGGGGRGMRIVHDRASFGALLDACKTEALSSFGSDHVLLEKYITKPKHIEVQILADQHQNIRHIGLRDCSTQRKHQKIIEEAGNGLTFLSDHLKERMLQDAVKIATEIGYVGAGTIEFLYDAEAMRYYFMEMNTRLQVEHPVSEMVYDIDLVKWQIKIAQGDRIPFAQQDIQAKGHAIELRICMENPFDDFAPTTGSVDALFIEDVDDFSYAGHHCDIKTNTNHDDSDSDDKEIKSCHFRIDHGLTEGQAINTNYDGMIAKIIVHADHRDEAIMGASLILCYTYFGLDHATNKYFLAQLLKHESFKNQTIHTNDLDKKDVMHDINSVANHTIHTVLSLVALYLFVYPSRLYDANDNQDTTEQDTQKEDTDQKSADLSMLLEAFKQQATRWLSLGHRGSMDIMLDTDWRDLAPSIQTYLFDLHDLIDDNATLSLREKLSHHPIDLLDFSASRTLSDEDGSMQHSISASILDHHGKKQPLWFDLYANHDASQLEMVSPLYAGSFAIAKNRDITRLHKNKLDEALTLENASSIMAPMPGKICDVHKKAGDSVKAGDIIIVMEAMKTQHHLTSPKDGVIAHIHCSKDDQVGNKDVLVELG